MAGANKSATRSGNHETRLILVGLPGSGKSATGNTILGRRVFNEHVGIKTKETTCRYGNTEDKSILVVDTPSLIGDDKQEGLFNREIAKWILLSSPGPHAIVLVISISRLSKDLQFSPKLIDDIFGADAKRYMIVALTGGDELRHSNMTKDEYLSTAPSYMSGILTKYPVVVINNRASEEEKRVQVQKLLSLIQEQNEKCLSNELYRRIEVQLFKEEEEEAELVRVDI